MDQCTVSATGNTKEHGTEDFGETRFQKPDSCTLHLQPSPPAMKEEVLSTSVNFQDVSQVDVLQVLDHKKGLVNRGRL